MKLSQLPLLIGSNFPVVALESPLPERMAILEHILRTCGLPNNLPCLVWNVGQAVLKEVRLTENGTGIKLHSFDAFKPQMDSRIDVLNFMMGYTTSVVFILENLHPWLAGSGTAWQIVSQVTNVFYDFLNDNSDLAPFSMSYVRQRFEDNFKAMMCSDVSMNSDLPEQLEPQDSRE